MKKTYTPPAIVACTDAVQNTMGIKNVPGDGNEQQDLDGPGSVGFYL